MKRTIIGSEAALVDLLNSQMDKIGFGIETIEQYLGIEFALVDGTYASDRIIESRKDNNWDWEGMDLDCKVYRRKKDCELPTSYPVLVLYNFDSDYDRIGKVTTCVFDFVTKEDVKDLFSAP